MITMLHKGVRVSRDPQKWLRNMCTTPKKHKLLFLLFKSKKENISLIKNAKTCFRFFFYCWCFWWWWWGGGGGWWWWWWGSEQSLQDEAISCYEIVTCAFPSFFPYILGVSFFLISLMFFLSSNPWRVFILLSLVLLFILTSFFILISLVLF